MSVKAVLKTMEASIFVSMLMIDYVKFTLVLSTNCRLPYTI